MEREACVCDHGFERSDLCAEIIIIIIMIINSRNCSIRTQRHNIDADKFPMFSVSRLVGPGAWVLSRFGFPVPVDLRISL